MGKFFINTTGHIAWRVLVCLFFYIWKNERERVTYSFVRNLTEEEAPLQEELKHYKNALRNSFAALFVLTASITLFISFLHMRRLGNLVFDALIGWILLITGILSLIIFLWNVSRIDQSNALKKDLDKSVVKIEGALFKTELGLDRYPRESVKSLRMGHYDFEVNTPELERIWNSLIDNTKYLIEFSPGTKKIRQISPLD